MPLLPELAAVLKASRPLHPSGLVCSGPPTPRRSLYRTLRRLWERAGIQRPSGEAWHLLRHSFGTMLMRAGVPMAVIGRLLPHHPGSTTTALYLHPDDGDLVKAMNSLARTLQAGRG